MSTVVESAPDFTLPRELLLAATNLSVGEPFVPELLNDVVTALERARAGDGDLLDHIDVFYVEQLLGALAELVAPDLLDRICPERG